jgi:cell shape-determining protein MreC
MSRRTNTVSDRLLFAWGMLAGIIILFAPQRFGSKLQFAFAGTFRQPLILARSLSLSMVTRPAPSDMVTLSRYKLLRNKLANVKQQLASEREKVDRLSGLRGRPVWKGVDFVLADVISASVTGPHSRLMINRGANDGLRSGQFVLGDQSIIGTVFDVEPRTARIRLITDPASKIAVRIATDSDLSSSDSDPSQTQAAGIMQGQGGGSAKVPLLPTTYNVAQGHVVYARKMPGLLDTPTITATVTHCRRDGENPLVWDITVEPACDLHALKQVAVVVMNPQQQP